MTESCNQTIFEIYDGYLEEGIKIMTTYIDLYKAETFNYFHHNAQYLFIILVAYIIFSCIFYFSLVRSSLLLEVGKVPNCKNVLFVIAHPDDECMFFGPSIVSLVEKPDANVYLLCLSRGNYQYLGRIRKEELYESCKILGIKEGNVTVMNLTVLPDDPEKDWDEKIVAGILVNFIETYSIDTLITFDKYGVSKHKNHIAVYGGLSHLCLEKRLPKGCKAYVLETVCILRKYAAHFDLPISFLLSSKKYIVPMDKRYQIRRAMEAHKTQYVWFRKLYMFFSRYIFVNTLKEVDILDLELEYELGDIHE